VGSSIASKEEVSDMATSRRSSQLEVLEHLGEVVISRRVRWLAYDDENDVSIQVKTSVTNAPLYSMNASQFDAHRHSFSIPNGEYS